MKTRERLLCFVMFLLFATVPTQSQVLEMTEFYDDVFDYSASKYERKDGNGATCALVRVLLPVEGCRFGGDVVGDVEYKINEYWVYLTPKSYSLYIQCPGCETLKANWESVTGRAGLASGQTYIMKLSGYPTVGQQQQKSGAYLVLTVTPANATVFIDGEVKVPDNGGLMEYLSRGTHSYEVSAPGYASQSDMVTIGTEKVTRSITLVSEMARLQLSCETPGTQFYVNDRLRGTGSWTGELTAGSYYIEARKEGYRTASRELTLSKREEKTVAFPALSMITGTLNVSYRPLNAEVWIDGKKVGTSPDVFDLMIGQHSVELRSSGYETRKSSVTISEGQETRLEGSLSKQTTVASTSSSGGSSSSGVSGASGTHKGHGYVDLGLPSGLKWATCNVGASSPEDYGDYYAWGETSTKSSYDTDNCETWEKKIGDIKGKSRDVAHVKWGGKWRMPTIAEFDELSDSDNCTWTWTTQGGHKGYKVTSKKNGNSIFLPAAGIYSVTSLFQAGGWGDYWSSTPYEDNTQRASDLGFSSNVHCSGWSCRNDGHTVRPVAE